MFEHTFSKFETTLGEQTNIYSYKDVLIPQDFFPELPFLFRAVLYRSKINMNTFILIVGNPRTSKSYCALKIAEVFSQKTKQEFDVQKQLTFDDIRKFLLWSEKAENSIFILDETGTSLGTDMFWELQARIMRKFVQCQGFRKNVVIWVLPSIVYLQKSFRFMTNYAIKTINQGTAQVYKVVVDQLLGKGYPDRIETLSYTYPSEKIFNVYEKMKKEWNDTQLKEDIEFMLKMEKKEKHFNKGEVLEMFKNKVLDYDFAFNELIDIGYDPARADLFLQNSNNIPSQ